ncbi:hypothetical protein LINPERHAP2_LOCUS9929 [Linum perenne]
MMGNGAAESGLTDITEEEGSLSLFLCR